MLRCENVNMAPVKKKHAPLGATYLAAWREHTTMNQDEIAEQAGISRTLLSKIEQGKSPYTQRTLEALARIYKCEPADLLSWHPVEKVAEEQAAARLLRRLALIPDGDELRAYAVLRSVWGTDDAIPSQSRSRDLPQDAIPRRAKVPSR